MTHTLDIGTDLDALIASVGDLTLDPEGTPAPPAAADERPPLISPKVVRGAWYR